MEQQPREQELLEEIRSGNEKVIGLVYTEFKVPFLKWANLRFELSEDTLIDIFQEAVIIFYQNIAEGKITHLTSSLKTYLFGIAKLLIFQWKKKSRKFPAPLDDLPDIHIEAHFLQQIEQEHQEEVLRSALNKLSPTCRQLLEYFYYYEFSLESIANRLHYKNADTVKTQKQRCMKQLKQLF